jgi:hypothetical protein
MATSFPTQQQQQAAAYEQYVRANWNTLSPYEQEEARAYLQAKYQWVQAGQTALAAPGWTVPAGYVCCALALVFLPIVFAPAGFGLGIYNATKGRGGHGAAQMVLSFFCGIVGFILGVIVWASV